MSEINDAITKESIYSKHTYIFPFSWNTVDNANKEYDSFKRIIEKTNLWEEIVYANNADILSNKQNYKVYQYVYPYVREVIFDKNNSICTTYRRKDHSGSYLIEKEEKEYRLTIEDIRIIVSNTGIALFIMNCANSEPSQATGAAVKAINDYGRRITLPFIGDVLCADKLEIEIDGKKYIKDYKEIINDYNNNIQGSVEKACDCDLIKNIMFADDYINIYPLLDDRMYVAFWVNDQKLVTNINTDKKNLYEFAYFDTEGYCTCQDVTLREKLIQKAVYNRWKEYGTLYTITEMGMGMISDADQKKKAYIYENYDTCYCILVYIAIMQMVSLVKFNNDVTDIVGPFAAAGKKLKRSDIRNIMNLQERYVAFKNQLLFSRVSMEQQGDEMYKMIRDTLSIDGEEQRLSENLSNLYEITNTDLNIRVNSGVSVLTWVSVILAFGALLYDILFTADVVIRDEGYTVITGKPWNWNVDVNAWIFILIIVLMAIVVYLLIRILNKRK